MQIPVVYQQETVLPISSRYWEIDVLRGLAVICMIVFHFVWDLRYVGLTTIDVFSFPWQAFARSIGSTFTFLVGLSLAIRAQSKRSAAGWRYALRRGGIIFSLGMLISAVTYVVIGSGFVIFGILHLLGLSLILAQAFVHRSPLVSTIAGIALFLAGMYLNTRFVPFPWLIWLGLPQQGRAMVDYYPMLPWSGAALFGVATARTWYAGGVRTFALPRMDTALPVRALMFLGRHSLLIYLLHQPILLGILLWLTGTSL